MPCWWQVPFWHSQVLVHLIATAGKCVRVGHVAFACDHLSCVFEPSLLSQLVTFLNGHSGVAAVSRPAEQIQQQYAVSLPPRPTRHSPSRPIEIEMQPVTAGAGRDSDSSGEENSRV